MSIGKSAASKLEAALQERDFFVEQLVFYRKGISHHLEQLIGLVGAGEVGEHECVDLLALKLVEGELFVAQLAVEGKVYLHLTIYVPLGELAVQVVYRFVHGSRASRGISAEV